MDSNRINFISIDNILFYSSNENNVVQIYNFTFIKAPAKRDEEERDPRGLG